MSTPRAPRTRNSKVAKAAKAGQRGPNVWMIVAIVAVVAFAAVIAVALAQEDDGSDTAATADVSISGETLPRYTDSPVAVGQDAPELSGTGLDGEPLAIDDDGRPKVLAFLAHWCPHCQNEVPRIVDWVDAGNLPDDVDLYGISTSVNPTQGNYPPGDWLEDEGWAGQIPTLRDDAASSAHAAYGSGGFPYFVAIDENGEVVAQQSGEIGTDQLEALIDQARTGTE